MGESCSSLYKASSQGEPERSYLLCEKDFSLVFNPAGNTPACKSWVFIF